MVPDPQQPGPPRGDRPLTLHRLFERQVEHRPDAPAAIYQGEVLSYGELEARSNGLAHELLEDGAEPDEPVALCVERGFDLLVGVLGILKAGGAYVPLDPAYPARRRAFMLEDSGARRLVASPSVRAGLPEFGGRVLGLDDLGAGSRSAPNLGLDASRLAYVMYTSGSTGRPKGVAMPHAPIVNMVEWQLDRSSCGEGDRTLQLAPFSFDVSVQEIFSTLGGGGTLCLVPEDVRRDPGSLLAFLCVSRARRLFAPFVALHQLARLAVHQNTFPPDLREVITAGEQLRVDASMRRFFEGLPDATLDNQYGPTECHVVTAGRLDGPPADWAELPSIGTAIRGARLHVLDERRQPVAEGSPGELYVGGACVARGYWKAPELTGERFVPEPGRPGERMYRTGDLVRQSADGTLEFLGRADDQVKIRGYRVEPGEIENVLTQLSGVGQAAVVVRGGGAASKQLVAYVVPEAGATLSPEGIRARLAEELPEHMAPSAVLSVPALPTTPSGKLDRAALPEPGRAIEAPAVAPRNPLEERVAATWSEVLGVEQVGIHDTFLELGGDSLRAASVAAALQESLGEVVYVSAVFEAPTVARLSEYLARNYGDAVARLERGGDAPVEVRAREARVEDDDLERLRRIVDGLDARGDARGEGLATAPRNARAAFVLGPPRSGSTLFRVMLAGHPELFSPPELDLASFDTLARRRDACTGRYAYMLEGTVRALMELGVEGLEAAREVMEAHESAGLTVREFYGVLQRRAGGRLLTEKSTVYAQDLGSLRRLEADFESPLYVHLVRHPCAVAHSFEKARIDRILRFEAPFSPRRLGELVWALQHRNLLEFLADVSAERQLRVTFEDLVARPRTELQRVCDFLGVELHEDMVDPYREAQGRMVDGLHPGTRSVGDVKFAEHGRVERKVAEAWRGELEPEALGDTTRALARRLGYADVPAPRGSGSHPLALQQERLWLMDRAGAGAAYNVVQSLRLRGPLEREALERGLNQVVARHPALRTRIVSTGSEPRQVVEPSLHVSLEVEPVEGSTGPEREAAARRVVEREAARAFDLERGPLIRASLVALGDEDFVLVVCVHHIVFDERSAAVFFRELGEHYRAPGAALGPGTPRLTYGGYAELQRERWSEAEESRQLDYWRERLRGAPAQLELPTDFVRPPHQRHEGGTVAFTLAAEDRERWKQLGREHGATLAMSMQSVLAVTLARTCRQDEVAIGLGVSGRSGPELNEVVGFFLNTVVLRVDLQGEPTFAEVLRRVQRATLEALDHAELPFERLVRELQPVRDPSRNPLFQVSYSALEPADKALHLPGVRVEAFERERVATHFDLELHVGETEQGLEGCFVYDANLFEHATIERLARHFTAVATEAARSVDTRVTRLSMLSRDEEARILGEWNDTATAYPAERRIHELFEEQARRHPAASALEFGEERLTYGELNERADALATELVAGGLRLGDRVGLCVERGLLFPVGALGILKAGGAYVPLDPDAPDARLEQLIADASVEALVTRAEHAGRMAAFGARVISIEGALASTSGAPAPAVGESASDPAYVIYTSGSTGQPKGVCVPHRAVVRLVRDTDYVELGPNDRVAQASITTFDAATFEIWGPLLNGGTVVGLAHEVVVDPARMATALREREVSVLFVTTALLNELVAADPRIFGTLRVLLFGGEAVDPRRVRTILERGAPEHLLHVYGPTENTTFSTWHEVRQVGEQDRTVPIGRPVANTRAYVLDPVGGLAPVGVPGELHLGGDGLGTGYLNAPELTAERFVPDPFSRDPEAKLYRTGDLVRQRGDGALEFVGRVDHQLKIRGHRIEPGEVEAVVRTHPEVREAIVLGLEDSAGDKQLAAYFAGSTGPDELRAYLVERLPSYLVPSAIVAVDELPLTANGKVDRAALPEPPRAASRRAPVAPTTPTEQVLAEVWADLLGVERVGTKDDFFELGGHSLMATRVLSRVRERFGVELSLASLFDAPTVADLAARIDVLAWARDSARHAAETGAVPRDDREEIEL